MNKLFMTAGALVAALLGTAASAAPLLVNGSFEQGPALNGNQTYRGNGGATGWSAVAGYEFPDVVGNGYGQGGYPFQVLLGAQDGTRFMDMNGASPTGGFYQDVTGLAAGQVATLSFWTSSWAQNSAGSLVASILDATTLAVLGTTTVDYPYNPNRGSAAWAQTTLQALIPNSGQLRIQFIGNSSSTSRGAPGLDAVALVAPLAGSAVPEPASWAMMIAGLGVAGAALRGRRMVRAALA